MQAEAVARVEDLSGDDAPDDGRPLKAYRCRLEPREVANRYLFGFSDARRWVWNSCVAWMEDANLAARAAGGKYAPGGVFSLTFLTRLLDSWCEANPWLSDTPRQVLNQALHDFIKARASFLSGAVNRPPAFKKARESIPSMRFPQHVRLQQDGVFLPKIGWVRYRNSFCGGIPPGELRSATVKFENGHWQISLLMRLPAFEAEQTPASSVGLDYGVKNTLATSGRVVLQAPTMTEAEDRQILFRERRVTRCVPGSNRCARARIRLTKLRSRISRRIHNWRHNTSTALSKNHGLIAVEDLVLKNMTASARGTVEAPGTQVRQKAGLNRALLEPGFGILRQQLAYKQAWRGHTFIAVDPAYTSQTCPTCGHVHPDNRPDRDHFRCVRCGRADEADFVAAENILRLGQQHFLAEPMGDALAAGHGRDCAPGPHAPRGYGVSHSRTKPRLRQKTHAKGIPAL